MDDLPCFSNSEPGHLKALNDIIYSLREHTLFVSPKKSDFNEQEIRFLGLVVWKDGIIVDAEKVDFITYWLNPESSSYLRSFPGLIQVFWQFIMDFSGVSAPLSNLANLTKNDRGIQNWDYRCDQAFVSLNEPSSTAPIRRVLRIGTIHFVVM